MITSKEHFRSGRLLAIAMVSISAAASVMAWTLSAHFGQSAQSTEKVIEKEFTRNEVVEIGEIKVSQKAVDYGKAFAADDEWLSKVAVRVKNISNRPIVFLEIGFDFPETKASGNEMSYRVAFGQRPGSKFPQSHDPLYMMPSETLDIALQPEYTKLKSFVEHRHRITNLHKLSLSVVFVIFADKTGWAAGNFYRQNPENPDQYLNVGDHPPQ